MHEPQSIPDILERHPASGLPLTSWNGVDDLDDNAGATALRGNSDLGAARAGFNAVLHCVFHQRLQQQGWLFGRRRRRIKRPLDLDSITEADMLYRQIALSQSNFIGQCH